MAFGVVTAHLEDGVGLSIVSVVPVLSGTLTADAIPSSKSIILVTSPFLPLV